MVPAQSQAGHAAPGLRTPTTHSNNTGGERGWASDICDAKTKEFSGKENCENEGLKTKVFHGIMLTA